MKQLATKISKNLHIPLGTAVIISIILTPKIIAIPMLLWYLISLLSARKLNKEKE